MNSRLYDFSLIIACYADAPHLFARVQTLARYFAALTLRTEFIFVEDASPLNDKAEIERCLDFLRSTTISAKAIYHSQNQGRGRTVQDGFEASEAEIVGFIDIDLEHSYDALLTMIQKIQDRECEGIVGTRVLGAASTSVLRSVLSHGYRTLVHSVLPLPVPDTESGLKLFLRAPLLTVLPHIQDKQWFWDTEIVYRAQVMGLRIQHHEIVFRRDPSKKSTVLPFRDSIRYLRTLFRFRLDLGREQHMVKELPRLEGRRL